MEALALITMPYDELREVHREIHFRDPRPPHEIQFQLERELVTLFQPNQDGAQLVFRGATKITGFSYLFELRFDAALPNMNYYTLRMDAYLGNFADEYADYFRSSSESWFGYWTKDFQQAPQPDPGEGSVEGYRMLAEQAVTAESHLTGVGSVQQAILAEMRKGSYFATAHHEGGTTLCWRESHFVRVDYGESDFSQTFDDETSFLVFLRQFYDSETSMPVYPAKLPEFDVWKLILRLLLPAHLAERVRTAERLDASRGHSRAAQVQLP